MSAVSKSDAERILAKHNCARKRYGQKPLKWDWGLAADAAVHADRCIWAHATEIGKGVPGQGENLALAMGRSVNVDGWLEEEPNFSCADNRCKQGQCGHWTQILWNSTDRVGCALAKCGNVVDQNGKSIGFRNAELLACRYNPPGNFIGRNPVSTSDCQNGSDSAGRPCSAAVESVDGDRSADSDSVAPREFVSERRVEESSSETGISSAVLQVIIFAVAVVLILMVVLAVRLARKYYAEQTGRDDGRALATQNARRTTRRRN